MATGGIPDPHSDHPMITDVMNLPVDPKKNDVNKTAVRVFTGAEVYQPVRMSNKRNRQGQSVEHSTAGTTPIATSNRFALLANAPNGKAKSSPRSSQQPVPKAAQTQPPKPEKPAPFYVRDTRVIEILDDIMTENQISNYDRTILRMGNEAKLQVSTVDDYRKIQKAFNEKGIPYFTFQLKSERSLKVVIKGIPPYITADKVKAGLVQSGFKPRSAQTILNHKGEKCCMVMVELESKTLRMIAGADWYINNECIHRDLEMPTVREKIQNISSRHITRLAAHPNDLAACLPLQRAYRRLKRADPLDLPSRWSRIPG
ncbi:hypothetical protein DMENIID0001_044480 [Sergentomyia squamirostris]